MREPSYGSPGLSRAHRHGAWYAGGSLSVCAHGCFPRSAAAPAAIKSRDPCTLAKSEHRARRDSDGEQAGDSPGTEDTEERTRGLPSGGGGDCTDFLALPPSLSSDISGPGDKVWPPGPCVLLGQWQRRRTPQGELRGTRATQKTAQRGLGVTMPPRHRCQRLPLSPPPRPRGAHGASTRIPEARTWRAERPLWLPAGLRMGNPARTFCARLTPVLGWKSTPAPHASSVRKEPPG